MFNAHPGSIVLLPQTNPLAPRRSIWADMAQAQPRPARCFPHQPALSLPPRSLYCNNMFLKKKMHEFLQPGCCGMDVLEPWATQLEPCSAVLVWAVEARGVLVLQQCPGHGLMGCGHFTSHKAPARRKTEDSLLDLLSCANTHAEG